LEKVLFFVDRLLVGFVKHRGHVGIIVDVIVIRVGVLDWTLVY
jgi:hypothetical protein